MKPDLFNDAAAVLPVLILAKVADRQRRQRWPGNAQGIGAHRAFVLIGFAGLIVALTGAAVEIDLFRVVAVVILIFVFLFCGILFLKELLGAEGMTRKSILLSGSSGILPRQPTSSPTP